MAKIIQEHQSNCTGTVKFNPRMTVGFGSEIHIWSQALCNSMQSGTTLLQLNENWQWNDEKFCKTAPHKQPFSCYFNVRTECPHSAPASDQPITHNNRMTRCPKYIRDMDSRRAFRAAAMEYLFSDLNPALVDEARRSIVDVFGQEGVPEDLITMHVRWGDKSAEMTLVEESEFYGGIEKVVTSHNLTNPHIYISTESSEALVKIQGELDKHGRTTWKLHHYAPLVGGSHSVGGVGKNSLIALLLAMEAKYYVLTTGSNWSRVMNELRTNVVDVACGNCTEMLNLREANEVMQDW